MKFLDFVAKYKPEVTLEQYQRDLLERLDQLDMAELEARVLASQIREDSTLRRMADRLVLGIDFGEQGDFTSVCIVRKVWYEDGKVHTMIIDDIYTEPARRFRGDGIACLQMPFHADDPLLFDIKCKPELVEEEPEPRAKNGALANRKTEQAKAKLPFYHKNRRF